MNIIKPPKLKKGDTIGIISPASAPMDLSRIDKGITYLEKLGYRVKEGKYIRQEYGYLSGTDEERLSDLHDMFSDKNVKAIFCTRGGYGTPRILDKINYSLIRKNPKIFVGYSDLTGMQNAILRKTGLITFSGPMIAVEMYNNIDPYTEENFWKMITSSKKIGQLLNPENEILVSNKAGKASGLLLGGNLSLVMTLFGTPYLPSLKNNILIIEDIDEEPYKVDRYLAQIRLSGLLKGISGLILGEMTDCEPKDKTKPSLSLEQVLKDYLSDLKIPLIQNLKYGHVPKKLTIPFGIKVKMDSVKNNIELLESAVL